MKIALIGAGSAQFGLGMLGDIFQCPVLRGSEVALHDIKAEALASVASTARRFAGEKGLPFTISATTERAEALRGADVCIIAIEVGDRFRLWEQDWRIPQQYGLKQVYGENGGPGGLFHALRIIPPILEICADLLRFCPQAYVFNYSNPMTRICTAVRRRHPELRFFGLCHEVDSLAIHLTRLLETPLANLQYRAGGLNHFGVLLSVRYRDSGRDAYPDVRARAAAYFQNMPEFRALMGYIERTGRLPEGRDAEELRARARAWGERGLFRVLLETYGYLPVTTDSHLGEYLAWAHEVVDHWGILDFYAAYKEHCRRAEKPPIHSNGYQERVVPIIQALLEGGGYEDPGVNVMNRGLISSLPEDIVVEAPASVDPEGIHPVALGALPRGFAGLLATQAGVIDLSAEAALQGSRELALQALLADPVVDSFRAARQTLEAMLALQKEYLGYLK
jgi:alpha-galactosidase